MSNNSRQWVLIIQASTWFGIIGIRNTWIVKIKNRTHNHSYHSWGINIVSNVSKLKAHRTQRYWKKEYNRLNKKIEVTLGLICSLIIQQQVLTQIR